MCIRDRHDAVKSDRELGFPVPDDAVGASHVYVVHRTAESGVGPSRRQSPDAEVTVVAFRCVHTAYTDLKTLYTYFLYVRFVTFAMIVTVSLYLWLVLNDVSCYPWMLLVTVILKVISVFQCMYITSDFQAIEASINNIYWKEEIKVSHPISGNVRKWFYKTNHRDVSFECGYFTVESALLWTLFDFCTLFIFATFP